ncbi:MAG TPA: hypothetical protein VGF29_04980 [Hyphomicrobiaceae bacterium]
MPDLAAIDLDDLGRLMGIPRDRREYFSRWLVISIEHEWRRVSSPPTKGRSRAISFDARSAKSGRAFLRGLKRHDKALADRVEALVGAHLQAQQKGRRRGSDQFATFVGCLLHTVSTLVGLFFPLPSFNGAKGTGPVVVLLDRLRPLMPPGFIPHALPHDRIERLVTQMHRFRREMERDPWVAVFSERLLVRFARFQSPPSPAEIDEATMAVLVEMSDQRAAFCHELGGADRAG